MRKQSIMDNVKHLTPEFWILKPSDTDYKAYLFKMNRRGAWLAQLAELTSFDTWGCKFRFTLGVEIISK